MISKYAVKFFAVIFFILFISSASYAQSKISYVGSAKCMHCHKAIYENWKDTLHNKSQQELSPTNDTVVVEWKGTIKLKAGNIPEVAVKLGRGPDSVYHATLVDAKDQSKEVTYNIVRTYGGWGWKQRYQIKIGNNHYILPIQWNQASSRWVPYNLQNWYNEDGSLKTLSIKNSFEMKCAGCHNTGLVLEKTGDGYESTYAELNTGCEKCHGPGSQHVKNPKAKGRIANPRKLTYERALESCGQCHNRGVSVPNASFEFPWNDKDNNPYKLGEPLSAYYQYKQGLWGVPDAHSRQHHQQWNDLIKSKHYKAKVNCFDCHNPHGGAGRFQLVKVDFNNTLCLSCHAKDKRFSNPANIKSHTKHNYAPETKGTSRCSGCHMVKTAASAEADDVHSHDFRVIKPVVSLESFKKDPKNKLPNSCSGCHKDWIKDAAGLETGVMAYESLFGK